MLNLILSLLLIFPLVLQENIIILFAQFLVMILLAFIRKKRVKLLPSFFITISLVFFSLLSPFGKVWLSFGKFTITEGAFFLGLKKSFVLCGMVFISQLATSFDFNIKGAFGKMISEVFYWFNIFSSAKKKNKGKKVKLNLKSVDEYLCEIYFEDNHNSSGEEISFAKKTSKTKIWTVTLIFINLIFLFLAIWKQF